MKSAWTPLVGACLLVSGCSTLRTDPLVTNFTSPAAPSACDGASSIGADYVSDHENVRSAHAALATAKRRLSAARTAPALASRSASTRAVAQQEAENAKAEVSTQAQIVATADTRFRTNYKLSDKADVCLALKAVASEAVEYNSVAKKLSTSDATASGVRIAAAFAGASLLALKPEHIDNLAGAALIGGGAEAWRNGLRPGERSAIYQTASLRLACVVNRGSTLVSFFPTNLDMTLAIDEARADIFNGVQFVDRARANPPPSDQRETWDMTLARLQRSLADLQSATDDVTNSLLAREIAAQRIHDAAAVIRNGARDQLKGIPFNAAVVVDLINKLPESMPKKPLASAGSTEPALAPAPEGGGARSFTLPPRDRAITTEQLRELAAEFEAETTLLRTLLVNDDAKKYKAIGECAVI